MAPMDGAALRQELAGFLHFARPEGEVPYEVQERVEEAGYTRLRIDYPGDEGDRIPAFLLLPQEGEMLAAVLVHHQHHGQRHLGKSEVCGLVGDPLLAFAPALARQGLAVLAPDSICFEERRLNGRGTEPHEADTREHFNALCHRLVQGDTLMRKVLDDSARGLSVLLADPRVDPGRVGALGHSYGGSTVLFHAALDDRIRYAGASGAAVSYRHRIRHERGIEMAQVIPGFAGRYEIADLVTCCAGRPLLLVSATEDAHSADAAQIVATARRQAAAAGMAAQIDHIRYDGGHDLTPERFEAIVGWMVGQAARTAGA